MVIHGLEPFLNARGLIVSDSVALIGSARVGIEGYTWLLGLPCFSNEPLAAATGGLPLTLESCIDAELAMMAEQGITPFFVFPGMSVATSARFMGTVPEMKAFHRAQAWRAYEYGDPRTACGQFLNGELDVSPELVQAVLRHFRRKGVQFLRAPHLGWPQLAWLAHPRRGFVSAVVGGLELLLFGSVPRVVLKLNLKEGTISWVDPSRMLQALGMSTDQFVDACILAGFFYHPTVAEARAASFENAVELVQSMSTGYRVVSVRSQLRQDLDAFIAARSIIRNHIVVAPDLTCQPMNLDSCPANLDELIGPALPPEVYFAVSQGLVSSQVVNNLTSGILIEAPPLADSEEYRNLLVRVVEIRAHGLGLLSCCLCKPLRAQRVLIARWFAKGQGQDLPHHRLPEAPLLSAAINLDINPKIPHSIIERELGRQTRSTGIDSIDFWFVVGMLVEANSAFRAAAPGELQLGVPLTDPDEMLVLVLHHVLEARGFVQVGAPNQVTQWGVALRMCSSDPETALLLVELLRFQCVSGAPLKPVVIDPPQAAPISRRLPSDAHVEPAVPLPQISFTCPTGLTGKVAMLSGVTVDPHQVVVSIRLVSRVCSTLAMTLKNEPWRAELDRDLAMFDSMVKAVHRSLRNLTEMAFLHLLLRGHARLSSAELALVAARLPFATETSAIMGIVVRAALVAVLQGESGSDALARLETRFPVCANVKGDLARAFAFWKQATDMVVCLSDLHLIESGMGDLFAIGSVIVDATRDALLLKSEA